MLGNSEQSIALLPKSDFGIPEPFLIEIPGVLIVGSREAPDGTRALVRNPFAQKGFVSLTTPGLVALVGGSGLFLFLLLRRGVGGEDRSWVSW